jgi:hypothetical protein
MLFRKRRSRTVIFVVLGCLALLILIRFGEVRVLAQLTPTPSEDTLTYSASDLRLRQIREQSC